MTPHHRNGPLHNRLAHGQGANCVDSCAANHQLLLHHHCRTLAPLAGSWSRLEALSVNRNNLSGEIPASLFFDNSTLHFLNLEDNSTVLACFLAFVDVKESLQSRSVIGIGIHDVV
jgi:hypothetical protein